MSTQIFKRNIPISMVYSLLDIICLKNENYYIFNKNAYRKGIFNETIPKFIEDCRPYYHISKEKYLDRKMCYNSFTTVLRQICNFNKITYTSQIKYDKSKYDIIYYIYFNI
jgi:hypothetical protein